MPVTTPSSTQLRARTRRILWFGARAVFAFIWWEVILRAVLGRERVNHGALERYRRIAHEFRDLSVSMGGVLIKVGQFVSSRVDVLPKAITDELADLQDEVPPEKFEDIRAVVETELGKPLDKAFALFDSTVEAAASLGQVHGARLLTGEKVVVKVQRPGITVIVATDLDAVRTVLGWIRNYGPIRRRVDLVALLDEFSRILYQELDYVQEAENALTFAANFADDPDVYVPRVYRELSTRRVLVLEDVRSIKITDMAALEATGVDRRQVASRLFNAYLQQYFEDGFFHADPHPGNLFVRPTGDPAERPRPFVLTFVDFGMTGRIAPSVRAQLREFLVGLTMRDASRMVRAEAALGFFLPGADLKLVEQATERVFARFYGMTTAELMRMDRRELHAFAHQFTDLLFELPFQVPQDYIYLVRAAGILSGMCSSLDSEINYWTLLEPYAQKILQEEATGGLTDWLAKATEMLGLFMRLPAEADRFLSKALASELEFKVVAGRDLTQDLRGLTGAIDKLVWGIVFAALFIAGTMLLTSRLTTLGVITLAISAAALVGVILAGRR
jgi:predicted unusual protein kinase regulating ubiquinone biosynthesis (AarF/ABC1/UbiB family)